MTSKIYYPLDKRFGAAEFKDYLVQDHPIESLGPIQRLNVLVGANNSGKSRFMRCLLKSNIEWASSDPFLLQKIEKTIHFIESFYDKIDDNNSMYVTVKPKGSSIQYLSPAHQELSEESSKDVPFNFNRSYFNGMLERFKEILLIPNLTHNCTVSKHYSLDIQFVKDILSKPDEVDKLVEKNHLPAGNYKNQSYEKEIDELHILLSSMETIESFKINIASKVYIPILRTPSALYHEDGISSTQTQKISVDIFQGTTRRNYGITDKDLIISTGYELYDKIKAAKNSHFEKRKDIKEFEDFMSKMFFHGQSFEITSIDHENNKNISILINDEEREIQNLGDGIQSILIFMYSLFTSKENSWIFIEEPENNLHPGYQRILIDQILNNEYLKNKKLKFFFTTHSNHLLDLTLNSENISIFIFEKMKSHFHIRNVGSADIHILNSLGVNNSSVFLANCSIWIEGISDRHYIRAYLNAYLEEVKDFSLKEDIHFSFFEYAGSNVIHYLFSNETSDEDLKKIKAQSLSNRIFLIADRDKGKEDKHAKMFSKNSNFQYKILDVREIENLLSPIQLKNALPLLSSKIQKDNIDHIKDDYKNEYLGKYLTGKKIIPKTHIAKSGTLKTLYKLKLSEIITNQVKWNEMSTEAQSLTKDIFKFISNANKSQIF